MDQSRTKIIETAAYLSFGLIFIGLIYHQIARGSYYRELSLKNTIRLIPIDAARGDIYDRKRQPMAQSTLSFDLVVIPQEVRNIQKVLQDLSEISSIPFKELLRSYDKNYHVPFAPVKVATNLKKEKAFYIAEKLTSFKGALIQARPIRSYPQGSVGSHVIGYIGRIPKEDFEELKDYGYKIQDMMGKGGIEGSYDPYLRGENGGIQVEVDARSREVKRLGVKEPRKGKDIQLTIDLGLQSFVDSLLEGKKGCCVIMDAKKGAILALASVPEFDPNIFIMGSDYDRIRLLEDKRRPLINRAVSSVYPPGSTFKIVVATAGIITGAITGSSEFVCKGVFELGKVRFGCWKEEGHGPQNILQAITHSCNVFFYNLGKRLGAEQIYAYALNFGLGNLTGIDLPGEKKGLVPGPLWKKTYLREPWYEGDTINYSIGQGYLLVTPIQMLRAVTIIANGGICPAPYLVDMIEGKAVAGRKPYMSRIRGRPFDLIQKGMYNAVESPEGTGQYARLDNIEIAGKTGTAQPGTSGNTHAWFAGYLPADNPAISIVVFLEHGGQGGDAPARMVRLIATYLRENGFLNSKPY